MTSTLLKQVRDYQKYCKDFNLKESNYSSLVLFLNQVREKENEQEIQD